MKSLDCSRMAAQGVWTLQEGMEKLAEKKKEDEAKKNRKRKVQKEPVASASQDDDIDHANSKKTRRAPVRKGKVKEPEVLTDSDSDLPLLPRESPAARKSPRIREQAIAISSDSEPELLPLPSTVSLIKKARKRCPSPIVLTNETPTKSTPSTKPTTTKPTPSKSVKESKAKEVKSRKKPLLEIQMAEAEVAPRGKRNRAPLIQLDPETSPARVKRVAKNAEVQVPSAKNAEVQAVEDAARKRKTAPAKPKPAAKAKAAAKPKAAPKGKGGPAKADIALPPLQCGTVISNERQKTAWRLDSVLGCGGFGYIYNTTNDKTKQCAVMKVEPQDNGPLFSEMHFYQRAGKGEFITGWCKKYKLKYLGIPIMLGSGIYSDNGKKIRYLIIPKYENDVLKLFKAYQNKLSMDTTLLMCLRMVEALHYCHDAGYVHCDIKSANLLTTNKDQEVHLADFGLARKYKVDDTHKVYKEEPAKAHDGTKEYTSIDSHKGVPLSRRGDLQVLSYCAIEWAGGALPWASWDNCDKIREEKISWQNKMSGLVDTCLGKSAHNKALKQFIEMCFKLEYKNKPDYTVLLKTLKSGLSSGDTGFVTWS